MIYNMIHQPVFRSIKFLKNMNLILCVIVWMLTPLPPIQAQGSAMMMEEKNGVQAVSYSRTLGLVLFGFALYKWGMNTDLAEGALYTLWGLIGIKGAKDVAAQFKK